MKKAQIIERTRNLFNIFKYIVKLNQYRFKDMHILTAIEYLEEFVDIDPSYIDTNELKEMIAEYCDEHDTGIYY